MNTLTTQSDSRTVLSIQNLGEIYRIRETLHALSAGTAVLQTAENSLYPICAVLEQMKILGAKILDDSYDAGSKRGFADEFNELKQNYQTMRISTFFNDRQLHNDDHTYELYGEGDITISWTPQSIPVIDFDPLASTKAAYQGLLTIIDNVAAYRHHILSLLSTLRKLSESYLSKTWLLLSSTASVNTASDAKGAAYRTATLILNADAAAVGTHSYKITSIAATLLS